MGRFATLAVVAAARIAHADPTADELVARGQELGKNGDYSRAIEQFKLADARAPTAEHACLIALSYTRRELWAQAEIFLTTCHERAAKGDRPPEWITDLDHTLAEKLAATNAAAITIVVTGRADARVAVSSFPPDETFTPRVIHVGAGDYTIDASAPGYQRASKRIAVAAGVAQTVTFTLEPLVKPPSRVPWIVVGAGAALGIGAVAYDLAALQPVRTRLQTAVDHRDEAMFARDAHTFAIRRDVTLGLGIGAAALIATGLVLRATVYSATIEVGPQQIAIGGRW